MMQSTAFDAAIKELLPIEGGYVNDPDDRGRETNYGITVALARKYGYTGPMKDMPLDFAKKVYRLEFWNPLHLDEIDGFFPSYAAELFDSSVNHGPERPKAWTVSALNALNRAGKSWSNLSEINTWDTAIAALRYACSIGEAFTVLKVYSIMRGSFYLKLTERTESQEKYLRGWLKRLELEVRK
jgi:lysozyme family protein